MTTRTDARIQEDGTLQHCSDEQQRTYTGFCECYNGDLDSPLSKHLAIAGTDCSLYWVQGENQAQLSNSIDNLKSFLRNQPGAISTDTPNLSVYVTSAPTLAG